MATQAEIEAAKELLSQWGHDVVASLSLSADYDIKKVAHAACVLSSISHEQQPVNERLLEAAKQYRYTVPANDGINGDCIAEEELRAAIGAAEAEIEKRRKPVTEEWLKEVGFRELKAFREFQHDASGLRYHAPVGQILQDEHWSIKNEYRIQFLETRGDVLDLLRVLGGAK